MSHTRPSWDDYFMDITFQVAKRSTCDRARVGAVIVKDKRILTTGYNGSPAGLPHCDEIGHLMVDGHCVRTLHAEQHRMGSRPPVRRTLGFRPDANRREDVTLRDPTRRPAMLGIHHVPRGDLRAQALPGERRPRPSRAKATPPRSTDGGPA